LVHLKLHSDTALMPILFGEICVAQFLLYKPYRLSIHNVVRLICYLGVKALIIPKMAI